MSPREAFSLWAEVQVRVFLRLLVALVIGLFGLFGYLNDADDPSGFYGVVGLGLFLLVAHSAVSFFLALEVRQTHGLSALATALLASWLAVGFVGWFVMAPTASRGGNDWLLVGSGLIATALLVVVFVLVASNHRAVAIGAFVAVVAVLLSTALLGIRNERAHRIERLEEADLPYALVSEERLNELLPGWSVETYTAYTTSYQFVQLRTSDDEEVRLALSQFPVECAETAKDQCLDFPTTANGWTVGGEISDRSCSNGLLDPMLTAHANAPTGSWTATSLRQRCTEPKGLIVDDLVDLLSTLQSATAEQWYDTSQALDS